MNKVDKINEGIVDLKERKLQMTEDNIHKLELVKDILTISKTDIVTVKMCAEYFEVNERRIRQVVDEIKEELEENGLKVYSKAEFLKEINVPLRNDQQLNGKSILTFEDGTELVFPNRGLILMTKRTVLNIGMLLKNSKVAKELRRRILDIVHDAEDTEIVNNVINEIRTEQEISQDMLQAIMSGDLVKESLLKTELLNLKNKRIEHLEGIVTNSLTIT